MSSAYRGITEETRADWRVSGRILRFVTPHRGMLLVAIIVLVVQAVVALASPHAISLAIDDGIEPGDANGLRFWGIVFCVLATSGAALR